MVSQQTQSKKEKIRLFFVKHQGEWISTRRLREFFGEAADRRRRELANEGMKFEFHRSKRATGESGFTFYWMYPGKENL